jgi:hypothetical protein
MHCSRLWTNDSKKGFLVTKMFLKNSKIGRGSEKIFILTTAYDIGLLEFSLYMGSHAFCIMLSLAIL